MKESCVSDCLKDPEMLDDNEDAGHLCDDAALGLSEQMKHMLSDWGQQVWAKSVECSQTKPKNRERYSVPHAARNPDTIQDCELATEDLAAMILNPPCKGAVRFPDRAKLPGHIMRRHQSVDLPGSGHPDHSQGSLYSGRSQMTSLIKNLQLG